MKVSLRHRRQILDDILSVDEAMVEYERFDGSMTEPVRQLSLERGDSAAALLVDRSRQVVILVEQFRYPAWSKDEQSGWLVEAVAGMVERGESPEVAVLREIEEEAGYRLDEVTHIATFFPSPGGSSERIFLYVGFVDGAQRIDGGGGVAGESEETRVVEISMSDVAGRLSRGELHDAKTVIGLQWLIARDRDSNQ